MGRRVLAVLAAVVVALVGVVAVLLYAKGADSRAVAGQKPVDVYVAQQVVPAGTTAGDAVANGLMARTQVAAKAVPAGALTAVDDKTSKLLALNDIAPGELVLSSRFGTTPLGQKALQVPDGQVAVAVQLSDPARVGTFVTPGSHIVIYDTYGSSGGNGSAKQTQVLLDDVLVIAMGSSSLTPVQGQSQQTQAQQSGTPTALVTVALAPDTAVKLVHGIQTGELYLGLRGTDAKVQGTKAVTDTTLFAK
ncbi:Flp pilus assembly protein CpaB [Oryzihumus leptocrescens]|uniref:Pilus assembly protein CpaB n=1 Tax=Oryzihumus leptocrescens TaxID=297536 RepID=A0A542ZGF6_9MICO|nr:RcpC/CpaB family pilus assembly protein [Oryzihumus leptocrescens]TQL59427.1 pilus assembly protein CpaB [Oryzihumus leptocrescens]